ncbi:MAG: hypothetical protein IPM94_06830 [bacterium]|nr:hypothetical protein [bacterium]
MALIIRRKWIILAISLSITAVATVSTLLSAERVTASARVMVIGRDAETPTFDRIATNWDLVMSTAAQVASSMPVAEAAAAALYDSVKVIAATDPDFPVVTSVGQLKRVLLHNVSCNQVGESNILNIMFSHVSERFALLAVDAIMKAYIDFNTHSQQNQPAVEYYTEQISRSRRRSRACWFPLDEPFIARVVVGSKKFLYLVLSILFAITLSLIVAWFVDSQDHRILDRMQAERSLDVPVLGSISSDQK